MGSCTDELDRPKKKCASLNNVFVSLSLSGMSKASLLGMSIVPQLLSRVKMIIMPKQLIIIAFNRSL